MSADKRRARDSSFRRGTIPAGTQMSAAAVMFTLKLREAQWAPKLQVYPLHAAHLLCCDA